MGDEQIENIEISRKRLANSPAQENLEEKRPFLRDSLSSMSSMEENNELTLEHLLKEIRDLKQHMNQQEERIVSRLRDEMKGMKEEITTLKTELSQKDTVIHALQKKIDDTEKRRDHNEQHNRMNNVRITGIPEKEGEDCEQLVMTLAHSLGSTFDIMDIERVHRVGKPDPQKTRAIIVRFSNYKARQNLTYDKKKLKEMDVKDIFKDLEFPEDPKIFLNDDLTKTRSGLAAQCRKKKKADKIKETWVSNCKIFVKKNNDSVKVINSQSDIDELP